MPTYEEIRQRIIKLGLLDKRFCVNDLNYGHPDNKNGVSSILSKMEGRNELKLDSVVQSAYCKRKYYTVIKLGKVKEFDDTALRFQFPGYFAIPWEWQNFPRRTIKTGD